MKNLTYQQLLVQLKVINGELDDLYEDEKKLKEEKKQILISLLERGL